MTDPVSLGVAATAAAVALTAGWLSLPRPPALQPARWFATALATILLGDEQAANGTSESWEARVQAMVRYHPAVEDPIPWLLRPLGLALQRGQAELIDALRGLTSPQERSQRLFVEDPEAQEAVLSDPAGLGSAYDPSRLLGHDCGWSAVASWAEGTSDAVPRSMASALGASWAVVGEDTGQPAVLDALVALGARRCFGDDLVEALQELAPHASDRLVIAVSGDAMPVLQALVASNGLRDQVLAVVAIGADIQGRTDAERARRADWLAANLTHGVMDLEAHRALHLMSVQWLDPSAPDALESGRFPPPSDAGIRDAVLTVHDLGCVQPQPGAAAVVAKALWLVTGLLILNEGRTG